MTQTGQYSETIKERKLLYSMKALADLLGTSLMTAQILKNSGKIPYIQFGRKVIFDADKVLEALENKTGKFSK